MHRHLAAGDNQHVFRRDLGAVAAVEIGRHRLAQHGQAERRRIAVFAVAQRFDRRFDDVIRGFEIGLADAEVEEVAPLALQPRRFVEHRESVLVAEARELTGLKEKSGLIREALKALIERESARRLARLGGSEPEVESAPRRRPERA